MLIGLVMVSQALYWLGEAGQEELIGRVVVTVLVQEVAPFLVGFILLGRSAVIERGGVPAHGVISKTSDTDSVGKPVADVPQQVQVVIGALVYPVQRGREGNPAVGRRQKAVALE